MAIRALIFDIGRVIIRLDIPRAVEGLSVGVTLSPEELWSAIEKDPRWLDWQNGRIAPRDWYLHLTKRLGMTLTFEQFTEAWNRALDPTPILGTDFFMPLAGEYRLALLSNTDPIHVQHLENSYGLFGLFPKSRRIYSCVVGASKPDPLIFRAALKALKVKADEAVYTDDIAANVTAARQLGMAGIQFQSPQQLRSDLGALGVNPS